MSSQSGLRKRIEETVGKKILEEYCQKRGKTSGAIIMLPPIPASKFIDKLPEDVMLKGANLNEKEHQDAYEAEVKLYRMLEEVEGNNIVIHQLDYTHGQYCAFLPQHQCDKNNCKKIPVGHLCHKLPKELEGECDFIVIGDHFVAVFEVKGLSLQNTELDTEKFKGCCESAVIQRKRLRNLVKSIDPLVMMYEFTMFPNINMEEVGQDELYLCDETILFSDHLDDMDWMIDWFETNSLENVSRKHEISSNRIRRCLLGLWWINQDNNYNKLTECSLE